MSIIEQAENFKWKEGGRKITEAAKEVGYIDKDLDFYELLRFFGIDSASKMTKEVMEKVETIFEYLKDSKDILGDARILNSKLGSPIELTEKLNKMYSHIYSLNLEEGFSKKREVRDKEVDETIAKKKKEKEIIESRERRLLVKESLERKQRIDAEKAGRRKAQLSKIKKDLVVKQSMEIIKRRKSPEPEKDVKVGDFV